MATVMGGGKGARPQLNDFVLRWDGQRTRQTGEEQLAIFRALASQWKD